MKFCHYQEREIRFFLEFLNQQELKVSIEYDMELKAREKYRPWWLIDETSAKDSLGNESQKVVWAHLQNILVKVKLSSLK